MSPLISICIPAYKNKRFVARLLDSIKIQSFKDFEVVLTDDSPDNELELLCQEYNGYFLLRYYKNQTPLGTPANWNYSISKAQGEWIKLMHDDDWFADKRSLEIFHAHTQNNQRIIKAAYTNVFESGSTQAVHLSAYSKRKILRQPMYLFANNVMGPPSVLLVHKSIDEKYDERLKWRVDQEYYMRLLEAENNFEYIRSPLINVGISSSQVTQSCIYVPSVELPEGLILLEKHGTKAIRNIWVYDAWWRLFRNMNIRSQTQLNAFTKDEWPFVIKALVAHLKKIPASFLRVGVLSKAFMSLSYLLNYSNINR